MVSAATTVLVGLGMGVAYVNAPSVAQPCSVRNTTTHDSAGRTMWCNPPMIASHDVVWQYPPGS